MTTETLRLAPAPGLTVPKPDGRPLAADGETVPRTSFWLRRLADGDVVPVTDIPAETTKALRAKIKE